MTNGFNTVWCSAIVSHSSPLLAVCCWLVFFRSHFYSFLCVWRGGLLLLTKAKPPSASVHTAAHLITQTGGFRLGVPLVARWLGDRSWSTNAEKGEKFR